MSDIDTILETLELVAEEGIDVTEATYEDFFKVSPESISLMTHMDHLMRGRMLNALIMMVMMPEGTPKVDVIHFEVKTHSANGVKPVMYLQLFQSFHKAVKEALESKWTVAYEDAWLREITQLMERIDSSFATL